MPIKDGAWHDRMYNNRALVPNFAEHFVHGQQASAAARQAVPAVMDLAYGPGPLETLDVFPAAQKDAPVVVFIHGGYWRSLDKSDHAFVAPALRAMGACVVVVNYSLCPGTPEQPVTVPGIALQMTQALAWVWRHIGEHGGDQRNITVVGHSAGGHLAAMLLACDWKQVGADLPADLVRKALSVSGLFDLAPVRKAPHLQADLRMTSLHVRQASPALWGRPSKGVLYSVVGGDESPEFLRQNRLIQQSWGHQTVPVCEELPGLNHFSIVTDLTRVGSRLHALTQTLIHKQTV